MPRIAFLYRTDTHVSDRSPSSWKGDYPAEIWSNLEQIGRIAKEREITAVLDGGDYFHMKQASRNSHSLIVRSAATQRAYPCPTYCVEGNHDLAYNDLGSLTRQPLGVLYETGVFLNLREQVFRDGDLQVRVVGMPYNPLRTLKELLALKKQPGDDHLIAVVHALASEDPPEKVEDFFGESVFKYADLIAEDGPSAFLFGHWHRDQGVVTLQGRSFVNQGAVSRGALTHENVARTPKVSLIECDKSAVTVTEIPLLVAPAEDVFDFERKEMAEAERRSIETFIELLQEDASYSSQQSIEDNIRGFDVAAEVRDLALHYLARAREG